MKKIEAQHRIDETHTGYIYGTTRIQSTITAGPDNVMGRNVTTFLPWENVKTIALRSARTEITRLVELRDALNAEIERQKPPERRRKPTPPPEFE